MREHLVHVWKSTIYSRAGYSVQCATMSSACGIFQSCKKIKEQSKIRGIEGIDDIFDSVQNNLATHEIFQKIPEIGHDWKAFTVSYTHDAGE